MSTAEQSSAASVSSEANKNEAVASSFSTATTSLRPLRPLLQLSSALASGQVLDQADEATCVVQRAGTCIVGTRQGILWRLAPDGSEADRVLARGDRVFDVDLEIQGRCCVAGCADGRAVVVGIGEEERCDTWIVEHSPMRGAVLSVALSPQYLTQGLDGHLLCTGGQDGRLLLHKRCLLGGQVLVHEGEGPITRVVWRRQLVAWSNDRGVKVFNAESGQKVTYVPRPAAEHAASTGGQTASACSELAWASDDRLVFAWGPLVKVVYVLRPSEGGLLSAEVRHSFLCAEPVCGLAPVGPAHLAVLTANPLGSRASLSLCGYDGDVFYAGEVPGMRGVFPGQLRLGFVAPHLPMVLVAPRSVLLLQVGDFLEHAVQLLDLGDYEEAIRLANGVGDGVEGLRHIVCLKCLAPALKVGRFEEACVTVGRFHNLGSPTWQEIVVLFDRFGGLQHLAVNDVMPVPPRGDLLDTFVYDEVLHRLINCPSALVAVLHWWSPDIFSTNDLRTRLRSSLPEDLAKLDILELDDQDRFRVEALALLEATVGDVVLAARLLLLLGSSDVFPLFLRGFANDGPLVELALTSIRRLFEIDDREACALLVEARLRIPVDSVMRALQSASNSRWRHEYLKQLFAKDEVIGQDYHMQMVRLLAEYEPSGLLPFLRASERYPLEAALGVCQQRGLLEEQAYLLGRDGRVDEALCILLEKMGDVRRAVNFASEYQDPNLWEVLVSYVLAHPHLLVPLLEHLEELTNLSKVGEDSGKPQPPPMATPAHVLERLPPGTPVPRIASSVARVIDSYKLSASLYVSCNRLSAAETTARNKMCVDTRKRGFAVAPSAKRCHICGRMLNAAPPADSGLATTDGASSTGVNYYNGRGNRSDNDGSSIIMSRQRAVHKRCHEKAEARRKLKSSSNGSLVDVA